MDRSIITIIIMFYIYSHLYYFVRNLWISEYTCLCVCVCVSGTKQYFFFIMLVGNVRCRVFAAHARSVVKIPLKITRKYNIHIMISCSSCGYYIIYGRDTSIAVAPTRRRRRIRKSVKCDIIRLFNNIYMYVA